MKEFAQKHATGLLVSTIVLAIVLVVLGGSVFLHKGSRDFGNRGNWEGQMMQQRDGAQGGYGTRQSGTMQPSNTAPTQNDTTNTTAAPANQ